MTDEINQAHANDTYCHIEAFECTIFSFETFVTDHGLSCGYINDGFTKLKQIYNKRVNQYNPAVVAPGKAIEQYGKFIDKWRRDQ